MYSTMYICIHHRPSEGPVKRLHPAQHTQRSHSSGRLLARWSAGDRVGLAPEALLSSRVSFVRQCKFEGVCITQGSYDGVFWTCRALHTVSRCRFVLLNAHYFRRCSNTLQITCDHDHGTGAEVATAQSDRCRLIQPSQSNFLVRYAPSC